MPTSVELLVAIGSTAAEQAQGTEVGFASMKFTSSRMKSSRTFDHSLAMSSRPKKSTPPSIPAPRSLSSWRKVYDRVVDVLGWRCRRIPGGQCTTFPSLTCTCSLTTCATRAHDCIYCYVSVRGEYISERCHKPSSGGFLLFLNRPKIPEIM